MNPQQQKVIRMSSTCNAYNFFITKHAYTTLNNLWASDLLHAIIKMYGSQLLLFCAVACLKRFACAIYQVYDSFAAVT